MPGRLAPFVCYTQAGVRPLPYTEALNQSVDSPKGEYVPQAFSPIGRSWLQRLRYAGTYDQQWMENTAPLFGASKKVMSARIAGLWAPSVMPCGTAISSATIS